MSTIYRYVGGRRHGVSEEVTKRSYLIIQCKQANKFAGGHRYGAMFDSQRRETAVLVEDDEVYIFVGYDGGHHKYPRKDVCYWVEVDDEDTKFAILNHLAASGSIDGHVNS